MANWYTQTETADTVTIEFIPGAHRYWPPRIMWDETLPMADVGGRRVLLTGNGPVWMYAHAAATARAAGAGAIEVRSAGEPGSSDSLDDCGCVPTKCDPDRLLLTLTLRTAPRLSRRGIDLLVLQGQQVLRSHRPAQLCLTGQASVEVYARLAEEAVRCGTTWIACWTVPDGQVVILDPSRGQMAANGMPEDWITAHLPHPSQPLVIGVIGDPNRGKSVFSYGLNQYRLAVKTPGWRMDCDGQAPTPYWYQSMLDSAPELAREHREASKRDWSDAMEQRIADHLHRGREVFEVLIADLPGGRHKGVASPQRIPPGRERLFQEVDVFVLLTGVDDGSETGWIDALACHGLDNRIATVLTSRNPDAPPSLRITTDGQPCRGFVEGLDRSNPPADLAQGLRPGLDLLWPHLLTKGRGRRSL